jgi:hypothetical protein
VPGTSFPLAAGAEFVLQKPLPVPVLESFRFLLGLGLFASRQGTVVTGTFKFTLWLRELANFGLFSFGLGMFASRQRTVVTEKFKFTLWHSE